MNRYGLLYHDPFTGRFEPTFELTTNETNKNNDNQVGFAFKNGLILDILFYNFTAPN